MTLALTLAALRRHPFSLGLTALLAMTSARLVGISVPVALEIWAAAAVISFELWYSLEPFVLRHLGGYRAPSQAERELFNGAILSARLEPLIDDKSDLVLVRGLRCLIVSRDLLDFLEERALSGLLVQASADVHCANLAGVVLVWLGNLPVLGAWCVTQCVCQLGRWLGWVVGQSLHVPLVLWGGNFVRWSGRIFGSAIVGLLGATLLSSGHAATGLLLLLGWLVVPGVRELLAWESRRVERAADQATIEAGLGAQLVEALELLVLAEPRPRPSGLLSVLCRPGAPLTSRADRIRRQLVRCCGT